MLRVSMFVLSLAILSACGQPYNNWPASNPMPSEQFVPVPNQAVPVTQPQH
jgi:hypothetical protein